MTASIIGAAGTASAPSSFGRLAGYRAVAPQGHDRLDPRPPGLGHPGRQRAVHAATAANGWITNRIAVTRGQAVRPENLGSMDRSTTGHGLLGPDLRARDDLRRRQPARPERESGTLAWVASKPVTRASIWLSKWVTTTVMTVLVAGILPLVATVILVTVLYGALPVGLVFEVAVGLVATVAFFAAVGLALGTVIPVRQRRSRRRSRSSHYCRSSAGSSPSGRTCRRPCCPGRPPPSRARACRS